MVIDALAFHDKFSSPSSIIQNEPRRITESVLVHLRKFIRSSLMKGGEKGNFLCTMSSDFTSCNKSHQTARFLCWRVTDHLQTREKTVYLRNTEVILLQLWKKPPKKISLLFLLVCSRATTNISCYYPQTT